MKVLDRLKEYHLEIDDVRWYLSVLKAKELMALKENPSAFVQYIHSKKLEADLYNMEEEFLDYLQHVYDNKKIDEAGIIEILYQINREKANRKQGRLSIEPEEKIELDN